MTREYIICSVDGKVDVANLKSYAAGDVGKTFCVKEDGSFEVTNVQFSKLAGSPTTNTELNTILNSKVTKVTGTPDFKLAVDAGGLYYEQV